MKIVIAPDSFKGSMTSKAAAEAIRRGIHRINPTHQTVMIPMADGGEGTVDAMMTIMNGETRSVQARDPLGRKISAAFGWVSETKTAVIETAAASGLTLLTESELNPGVASTFGTGELVKSVLDLGAEHVILGLGGSATVDGGAGFLQALGIRFFNKKGQELEAGGSMLGKIDSIDSTKLDQRLQAVKWTVASDVTNPLLGNEGAVTVFGPQKGVKHEKLADFERGMEHFAEKVVEHTGLDCRLDQGSGAAGGLGYSLHSFFQPVFKSGLSIIAEESCLEYHLKDAALVLTGEGKIDAQSLYGKVPVGIGRLALKYEVPVAVFAGKIEGDLEQIYAEGIQLLLPIVSQPMSLRVAMTSGSILLEESASRLMRTYELFAEMRNKPV
ncbi:MULTISPECIES: glycerate kinase [unclassified Rossellomorea]|uniref:glycerate kinase n=1 Tax=unclassified Rossellomorea TaxID=2837526 RepID=UPI00262E2DFC|nr:glycerate kinase [uncultured Rossellomorea sp.]